MAAAALARLRLSFRRPWLWLGGIVALLVILPMLLWNFDHDFMTWNKQFGRLSAPGFKPTSPLEFIGTLFLGLPWLILHYITKWKQAKTLTGEDEQLLDELYDTARRLENRLHTVERIISADHPDFRPPVRSDEELAQLENMTNRRN